MQFQIISFKNNGQPFKKFTLNCAFFGLIVQGKQIEYFATIEALKLAKVQLEAFNSQIAA